MVINGYRRVSFETFSFTCVPPQVSDFTVTRSCASPPVQIYKCLMEPAIKVVAVECAKYVVLMTGERIDLTVKSGIF